jgi:hypothetical protein
MRAVEATHLEGIIPDIHTSELALDLRAAIKKFRVRLNQTWLALPTLYSLRHQLNELSRTVQPEEPEAERVGMTSEQLEGVWQLAHPMMGGGVIASSPGVTAAFGQCCCVAASPCSGWCGSSLWCQALSIKQCQRCLC